MSREQLLVSVAGLVLALPEDRPRLVAVDGMSCVGKTTLAAELADVLDGSGRPVVRVAYDDFHRPAAQRRRRGRLSAQGYLEDSYDPVALTRLVLEPIAAGKRTVVTASYDLAVDQHVSPEPVEVAPSGVVLVEGEFLLDLPGAWDVAVLLVADPAAVLARALERDADLGTPEQLREMYLRRYLPAWALYEERSAPWERADVVADVTDPANPLLLS